MADITNPTTNATIFGGDNPALAKAITSTTDGSKERLDVDAYISSDDSPTKYTLGTSYDTTGVSVSTTDVTLFEYTSGAGVIDFIATSAGNSTYEIAIYTDTVQRFRMTMGELGSDLAVANATNVPLWVETANKNFRWNPPTQVGFEGSFKIVARSTTGTNTIKYLVMYRTK